MVAKKRTEKEQLEVKKSSNSKRDYIAVTDSQRYKFIYYHIEKGIKIKEAARLAGVKYENAK